MQPDGTPTLSLKETLLQCEAGFTLCMMGSDDAAGRAALTGRRPSWARAAGRIKLRADLRGGIVAPVPNPFTIELVHAKR